MIKGCQKRVLWVKNIESECFEGAFFIVSDKSVERNREEGSMVAEANRIISSYPITNYFAVDGFSEDKKRGSVTARRSVWFLLGVLLTAAASLALQIF